MLKFSDSFSTHSISNSSPVDCFLTYSNFVQSVTVLKHLVFAVYILLIPPAATVQNSLPYLQVGNVTALQNVNLIFVQL
jgi:hypothetical protein